MDYLLKLSQCRQYIALSERVGLRTGNMISVRPILVKTTMNSLLHEYIRASLLASLLNR